jgi:hypothetical protein
VTWFAILEDKKVVHFGVIMEPIGPESKSGFVCLVFIGEEMKIKQGAGLPTQL